MTNPTCNFLKNGWKYVIDSNKCGKTITLLVLFKVGSINELEKERGISHFIEHLFFQGTTKNLKNSKDITKAVYQNGGYINAFTSYDYTGYYIKIESQHLEKAMKILSEILYHSKFTPTDLEKEKSIVIQENRKQQSNPMRILHELTYKNIYQSTPLEHPIGGYPEIIKNFNRKMVIDYLNREYGEAVVSVSGNTDISQKKIIEML